MGHADVATVFQEEITNTMRNIGANTVADLRPEMVGPMGPWVGKNRPSYVSTPICLVRLSQSHCLANHQC
jgi:hypothetical protein